jgi:hypothetical protein
VELFQVSFDIAFDNAVGITMDPAYPRANTIMVDKGYIVSVGNEKGVSPTHARRIIDCTKGTLLPGLNDAHIHLLSYANSLHSLDCSHRTVRSIADLQKALFAKAESTPWGQWIRGVGYDEFYLNEKRHPTRHDLDRVLKDHPVRLDHRSSHACVLNSHALEKIGISSDSPDPHGGVIIRDSSGHPTGLLLEMNRYVSERMPRVTEETLANSINEVSKQLLSWGITSIQDATPACGVEKWKTISRLAKSGNLRQRLVFMPGIEYVEEFVSQGLHYKSGGHNIRIGPVKLMVTCTSGSISPSINDIRELVHRAHKAGYPVAIHAVEEDVILAVSRILVEDSMTDNILRPDRIEHCSEATPRVIRQIVDAGVSVVSQPSFIFESSQRYQSEVPLNLQKSLYPFKSLIEAGIPLAAGSDAPVASPNPWQALYAAVTRKNVSDQPFHPEQNLLLEEAINLWTSNAAFVAGEQQSFGSLKPGMFADIVLLDRDITRCSPEELLNVKVRIVVIGGEIVWES